MSVALRAEAFDYENKIGDYWWLRFWEAFVGGKGSSKSDGKKDETLWI